VSLPDRTVLDNGAVLVSIALPSNPFLAFRGSVPAGVAAEGEDRGVAEFTSRLLLGGTRRTSAAKLADRLEGIGSTLEFHASEEVLTFQGRCTRETAAETVRLLVECLGRPAFPAKEVERVRGEILNDLRIEADDTRHRAMRALAEAVFPKGHPYGRDPKADPGRVRRISRRDLVAFHEAHVGPEGLIFAVTGDIDRDLIERSRRLQDKVYRLDANAGLRKLTSVNASFENTAPTTELLRYRSPDGFDLEGLVVKPRNYEKGKRYPLLVIVHGGPAGVFNYAFTPRRGAYPVHAFAEQGYVIFLPNPRGSGNYGEKFRQANIKDWGYGDYRDIMQGVDELIKQGVADPERMGEMGWSYGGYMTSWIVTQTDRFKAVSMGAGLSNLISMYGVTDIPEFSEAYFGGPPWEDMQGYLRSSAMNFVQNAKTPTLIQHGQEDRRVPISQGEEFYRALTARGVPVEMVVYPRQPHGIQEPRLIKDSLERNLAWFNKWVLGLEPPVEKKEEKKPEEKKD